MPPTKRAVPRNSSWKADQREMPGAGMEMKLLAVELGPKTVRPELGSKWSMASE